MLPILRWNISGSPTDTIMPLRRITEMFTAEKSETLRVLYAKSMFFLSGNHKNYDR